MTTLACPICEHEHDASDQEKLWCAFEVLTPITIAATEVGAPICSIGVAPGRVSFVVGSEDGLRELAAVIGFPEPGRGYSGLPKSQGVYAGVPVYLCCLVPSALREGGSL